MPLPANLALPDSATPDLALPFDNTYARLPEHFFARTNPAPVPSPQLIKLNIPLAEHLNLDPAALASPQGIAFLAGNHVPPGAEPIALAYAGHQFGHFVPQLGDGRANLLGEVVAHDGLRYDLQLKGSGPTPFSRRGDGRAALGPVLREYLLSEAMAALGVPTTRALAAVTTGQHVQRETPQPGAIFTRVAAGHLRVGTFQYFAARGDLDALRRLTTYAITRNYPELDPTGNTQAFLAAVIRRQADLIAHWMLLGFVHGVMNTDNMAISGETIDFGPCAFLEHYHPATVFSSIDAQGRYAFSNQPPAALWNLTRLAETLLPLLEQEEGSDTAALAAAVAALDTFDLRFQAAHLAGLRRKLGLLTDQPEDAALAQDLLTRMAANHADFTLTFRTLNHTATLSAQASSPAGTQFPTPNAEARKLFTDPTAYDTWAILWHQRLSQESDPTNQRATTMQRANPAIIPRNHLVEAALTAAIQHQNFQPFEDLLEATAHPFTDRPADDPYTQPATPAQTVHHTFCGT